MISVIFPCFNEEHNAFFKLSLERYSSIKDLEIICVDGGDSDYTLNIIAQYSNVKYFVLKESSRAARLNLGIKHARGNYIVLHHPRSILEVSAFEQLKNLNTSFYQWGAFTHQFDQSSLFYRFTSWYSNYVRFKYSSIAYLDHCVFLHRSLVGSEPLLKDVKIFEDTLLSLKLRKKSKPALLTALSTTSSVRFKKKGVFKQAFLNQLSKLLFILGVKPNTIDALYEKNLSLNSRYPK